MLSTAYRHDLKVGTMLGLNTEIQKPKGTEDSDPIYADIAAKHPLDSLQLQWGAQIDAICAMEEALPSIDAARKMVWETMRFQDGRFIGAGAGTSGRLIVRQFTQMQDDVSQDRMFALMAGGKSAVFRSKEGAEDDRDRGIERTTMLNPGQHDVVIGIAASGKTAFTIGALEAAGGAGGRTIALVNNVGAPLLNYARHAIVIESGVEIPFGSTRQKSGTGQMVGLDAFFQDPSIETSEIWQAQLESVQAIKRSLLPMSYCIADVVQAISHDDGRLLGTAGQRAGRILTQDFTELTPTFGWEPHRRITVMEGGKRAMFNLLSGVSGETNFDAARMRALGMGGHDVVIAVDEKGNSPYVAANLRAANEAGAITVAIAEEGSPLLALAKHAIPHKSVAKIDTVQKVILNMLSNQFMFGLGKVYKGYMVDMQPTNKKLVERAELMVQKLTGCSPEFSKWALGETKGWVKPTVLMAEFGLTAQEAIQKLRVHRGDLNLAVPALKPQQFS